MKKIIIFIIIIMNLTTVNASTHTPKYKIIAASNQEEDIDQMYETKSQLLNDYKKWVKGVDDVDQVLADHTKQYHATYVDGQYVIILGDGQGKSISGSLQVSYCATSQDIKKKSLLESLFS